MTKIETSFNGRDWSVLADGQKVGSVMDLRPAARGGQPFSATVVWGQPGAGALGGFPTVDAAVKAIGEAHARRFPKRWPFRIPPPKPEQEPDSEPGLKLEIVASNEFPETNSTVHFDSEVIGKIAKLPAFDGKPYHAMNLLRYYSEGPGFGHTGHFASREEAARAIHERWTLKPVKRPNWARK